MDDWTNYFTDFDRELEKAFEKTGRHLYGRHAKNLMKTDVHENENSYKIEVDLPGFKKEEINIGLKTDSLPFPPVRILKKRMKAKRQES